jgi:hypothetical protein
MAGAPFFGTGRFFCAEKEEEYEEIVGPAEDISNSLWLSAAQLRSEHHSGN